MQKKKTIQANLFLFLYYLEYHLWFRSLFFPCVSPENEDEEGNCFNYLKIILLKPKAELHAHIMVNSERMSSKKM